MTRNAEALEMFVRDVICYRLDTPDLAALLQDRGGAADLGPLLDERTVKQARLTALLDDYTDGTLSKADYLRAKGRVEARLSAIDTELERIQRAQFKVSIPAGQSVQEAWDKATDGWRRELMSLLIERITVCPTQKKPYYRDTRWRLDTAPEAIQIKWAV